MAGLIVQRQAALVMSQWPGLRPRARSQRPAGVHIQQRWCASQSAYWACGAGRPCTRPGQQQLPPSPTRPPRAWTSCDHHHTTIPPPHRPQQQVQEAGPQGQAWLGWRRRRRRRWRRLHLLVLVRVLMLVLAHHRPAAGPEPWPPMPWAQLRIMRRGCGWLAGGCGDHDQD